MNPRTYLRYLALAAVVFVAGLAIGGPLDVVRPLRPRRARDAAREANGSGR